MRAINNFILKFDKGMSRDKITFGSLVLFTPEYVSKHNEVEHMINHGKVVAIPDKYKEGNVEIGDTMWVHHNVSINKNNMISIGDETKEKDPFLLDAEEKLYHIPYTPKGRDNLCYLVKKKDGSYKTIGDVLFCTPNTEREKEQMVGDLVIMKNPNQKTR